VNLWIWEPGAKKQVNEVNKKAVSSGTQSASIHEHTVHTVMDEMFVEKTSDEKSFETGIS
jgi:hypothetical protein